MSAAGVVYVLDDDRMLLGMLGELLGTLGCEVECFDDPAAFLSGYRSRPGECLLCDVRMPGLGGLQVQKRLNELDELLPIIFMTGYAEVGTAVEAMKQGALDFLQKPFSPQELLDRVQDALALSRERHARKREADIAAARLALLSPRERDIAGRVAAGQSSVVIANALGISVRTVENHRAHIMDKLHVRSLAELVRLMP